MSYQLPGAAVDKGGSMMSESHRLHHQQHHHHHHQQQQQQQQQQLLQQPHHHSHHHHHAGQRDAAIAAWSRCNSSSSNSGAKGPGLAPTCEGDPTANTLPSRRGAQRATAFRSHGRTDARSPLALAKVEAPAPYSDSHCKSSARPPATAATAATAATGRLRGGDAAGGQRDLAQYVRGYLEAGGRDVGAEWEERYYATFSRSVECCSSDNNSRETSPVKANARSAFSTADSSVRGVQQGTSTAGGSNRALPQQGIGAAGSSGRGAPNVVGSSGPRSKDAGSATACTRGCEGDGASEGSGGSKSETRLTANGAHEGIPRIDIHECCYDDNAAAAAVDESGTLKVLGAAMGNSEQKGVQVGNSFSRSTKSKLGGSAAGDGKERSALSVMHSIGVQTEAACKRNNGGGSPSTPSAPSSNASKHSSDGLSESVDGASGTASGGGEKRSNSDEEGSEGIRDDISDIFRFLDDVSVCDSGTGPMHSRNDSCNSLARNLKSDSDCTPKRTPGKHTEQSTPLGSLSLSEQDHQLLQEVHLLQQEYKQQQQRDQQKHKDNNNHQGKQQAQLSRVSRQRGANEPDDELKVSVCKLVLRMGEIERKLETLTGVRAEISEVLAKLNKLDEKLVQEALPCLQSPTDEKPGEEYDNSGQQCSRGHRAHMPKSESGTEWGSSDASCGDSLRVQALRRSLLGRRSSRSLAEENSTTESKLVSMASSPHGDWKSGSSGGGGGGGGAGGGGGVVGGGCGMVSGAANGSGAVEKVAGCSNISGCPGMGGGGNNNNLVTSGLYVYEPGREYERRERYGDGQSGPIQMEVGYAFSAKPDNVQADEALVQQVYGGRISASTLRAHMKSNPLYREVPAGPGGEADGHRRGQPSWTLEEYTRHAKQRGKLSAIDLQTQESLNPNNLEYWMEEIYTPGYDSLLKRKEAEFRRAKLCKIAVLVLVAVCTVVLVIVVPICTVRT